MVPAWACGPGLGGSGSAQSSPLVGMSGRRDPPAKLNVLTLRGAGRYNRLTTARAGRRSPGSRARPLALDGRGAHGLGGTVGRRAGALRTLALLTGFCPFLGIRLPAQSSHGVAHVERGAKAEGTFFLSRWMKLKATLVLAKVVRTPPDMLLKYPCSNKKRLFLQHVT